MPAAVRFFIFLSLKRAFFVWATSRLRCGLARAGPRAEEMRGERAWAGCSKSPVLEPRSFFFFFFFLLETAPLGPLSARGMARLGRDAA